MAGRTLVYDLREPYGSWLTTPEGNAPSDFQALEDGQFPNGFVRAGGYLFFKDSTLATSLELHAAPLLEAQGHVVATLGAGCVGSSGAAPRIDGVTDGHLGDPVDIFLTEAPPLSGALLLHSFGYEPLALTGCTLYLELPYAITAIVPTDASGSGTFSFTFPTDWGLVGQPLYLQYLVADPGGSFGGVGTLTAALEVIAGP